jgi:hypothetical protein
MARHEEQREDLLREATALVERVELRIPGSTESIVAGFRRDQSASVFFGQQLVYQFNSANELRRAFANEQLYKAECGRLVQLTRNRTSDEVQLLQHEVSAAETADFLAHAAARLAELNTALKSGQFQIVGQVPNYADVIGHVRNWLAKLPASISLADRPGIAGDVR